MIAFIKQVALSIATVSAVSLMAPVFAQAALERKTVEPTLQEAVERIYEYGRGEADSGGISSIQVFANTEDLKSFAIVKELIESRKLSTSAITCDGVSTNNCTRLILQGDDRIYASFQPLSAEDFFTALKELDFNQQWRDDLALVEREVRTLVGNSDLQFTLGHDEYAESFDFILISEDRKTVVIVSGDYGA